MLPGEQPGDAIVSGRRGAHALDSGRQRAEGRDVAADAIGQPRAADRQTGPVEHHENDCAATIA